MLREFYSINIQEIVESESDIYAHSMYIILSLYICNIKCSFHPVFEYTIMTIASEMCLRAYVVLCGEQRPKSSFTSLQSDQGF